MSKAKQFTIRESIPEIKKLIKSNDEFLAQRLRVLLECKKNESTGISKRELSDKTGYDQNSAQTWRTLYIKGGIEALLSHNRKGFKPSVFSSSEHEQLKTILHNPENGIVGYKELQQWIELEMNKVVKYKTVYSYVRIKFGAKVKVARKSHVKKDESAVEDFKKTSINSVPIK
jgi:transposase